MSGKIRRVDFSPTEWLEGTTQLDNAARGMYVTACALMWARGGAITADLLKAACRDHGHAFKRQIDRLIGLGKLIVNDGQITNKRAINELQKAEERTAKASQNGSKGNAIKKVRQAARPLDTDANHQPSTINHQETEEESSTAEVVPLPAREGAQEERYAFEGKVLRLTHDDFDRWRTRFYGVADIAATLTPLDEGMAQETPRSRPREVFFRASAYLDKKHQEAVKAKALDDRPHRERYPNEGVFRKAREG